MCACFRRCRVNFMINFDTRMWDCNLIDQHFLWFEAQRTQAIPLCVSRQVDSIIRPRCKNGEYLVKTGYQQLCEDEGRGDELKGFESKEILESHLEA